MSKRKRNVELKPWVEFFRNGRFQNVSVDCKIQTAKGHNLTVSLHDTGVMQLDTFTTPKTSKFLKKINERMARSSDRIDWKDPWYLTLSYEGVPLSDLDAGVIAAPIEEPYTFEMYQQSKQQCDLTKLDQLSKLNDDLTRARVSESIAMNHERTIRESQLELMRVTIETKKREIEEAGKILKAIAAQYSARHLDFNQFLKDQELKRAQRDDLFAQETKQITEQIEALRRRALLSEVYMDMLMAKGALDMLQQQNVDVSLINPDKLAQVKQAYIDAEQRYKAAAQ